MNPDQRGLISLVSSSSGATTYLIEPFGQALRLVHLKIQQHCFWIRRFPIHKLVAGRMPALRGAVLDKTTSWNVCGRLPDVCADADSINRHDASLASSKTWLGDM